VVEVRGAPAPILETPEVKAGRRVRQRGSVRVGRRNGSYAGYGALGSVSPPGFPPEAPPVVEEGR
jgi:hypothetical protein